MTTRIVMLGGDGIGPEVAAGARAVLAAAAKRFSFPIEFDEALIGGAAIDATGVALPPATLAKCRTADAVFLGAVGGPKWSDPKAAERPELGLLALRAELGVFANLRPVAPLPAIRDASPIKPERLEGVDLMVVRELTGGMYFGEKIESDDAARDICDYTRDEVVRVTRVAGDLARKRRGKVTSVDKANVLATSRLWRNTVSQVMAEEYPDVMLEHILVDAAAMYLLQKPADFDVLLTENLFGDILTDEASVLAGSMGLLPSASVGEGKASLYEPIHGSAPDIAGRGIANPYGAMLSAAMLLRHALGREEAAVAVEQSVESCIAQGVLTSDLVPDGGAAMSTAEVIDHVERVIANGQ
ncbi:MAG: 3-isopropylmalate dehydrogenase [Gammaproteobacteria bacterium]